MQQKVVTRIVKIGNSQGIRIPKVLLEQAELGSQVELELHEGQLVVRAAHRPRLNWDEQFRQMAARGDDALLDGDRVTSSRWDEEEWEW